MRRVVVTVPRPEKTIAICRHLRRPFLLLGTRSDHEAPRTGRCIDLPPQEVTVGHATTAATAGGPEPPAGRRPPHISAPLSPSVHPCGQVGRARTRWVKNKKGRQVVQGWICLWALCKSPLPTFSGDHFGQRIMYTRPPLTTYSHGWDLGVESSGSSQGLCPRLCC